MPVPCFQKYRCTFLVDKMTDQPSTSEKDNTWLRIFVGAICSSITSYFLTYCSLHGVDFATLGISSEMVKGGIVGSITGFIIAPITFIYKLRDMVLWFRRAWYILYSAIVDGKSEKE